MKIHHVNDSLYKWDSRESVIFMKSEEATQHETSWTPFPLSSANTCHLASMDPQTLPGSRATQPLPTGWDCSTWRIDGLISIKRCQNLPGMGWELPGLFVRGSSPEGPLRELLTSSVKRHKNFKREKNSFLYSPLFFSALHYDLLRVTPIPGEQKWLLMSLMSA